MSGNLDKVLSRHPVALALVIEPLSRSPRRRWLSFALQAADSSRISSSFALLCGGALLTIPDLGIVVMVEDWRAHHGLKVDGE
jgi:hypothetical protein